MTAIEWLTAFQINNSSMIKRPDPNFANFVKGHDVKSLIPVEEIETIQLLRDAKEIDLRGKAEQLV